MTDWIFDLRAEVLNCILNSHYSVSKVFIQVAIFNIKMNECHVAASFDETETALDEDLDVERHGSWERRSWLP